MKELSISSVFFFFSNFQKVHWLCMDACTAHWRAAKTQRPAHMCLVLAVNIIQKSIQMHEDVPIFLPAPFRAIHCSLSSSFNSTIQWFSCPFLPFSSSLRSIASTPIHFVRMCSEWHLRERTHQHENVLSLRRVSSHHKYRYFFVYFTYGNTVARSDRTVIVWSC